MTFPAPLPPFKPIPIPQLFPAYSMPAPDLSLFEKQIQQLARDLARPYLPTFPLPTTKEAPMSTEKTAEDFTLIDPDGDKLTVESTYVERHGDRVAEIDLEDAPNTVYVTKADAPALALAILEAAGISGRGDGSASVAVRALKSHAHRIALKAQEERLAAEKLDAEALALLNAATGENYVSLSTAGTIADFWRRAARKAREIHAPAN